MRKHRYYLLAYSVVSAVFYPLLDAEEAAPKSLEERLSEEEKQPGYVINFNNIPIVEVIKFVSKVGKLNFVYKEEELNFNVTIVSEDEATVANVISALAQVLQVNGFDIIEDGNNVIIHRSAEAKAIAPVVSAENPLDGDRIPAIITRVFNIKNGNPTSIGAVLEPMLSEYAQMSIAREARRIIVTDLVGNIEKISDLLRSLDAPQASLELGSYVANHDDVESLQQILEQLIMPLSEGNPVILVPQTDSNTLFIVSTPFLIQESLEILKSIDSPNIKTHKKVTGENVFIYKLENQPFDVIIQALKEIATELDSTSDRKSHLVETIDSAHYIPQSNAIVFTGSKQALAELKSLLTNLDTPTSDKYLTLGSSEFYIYKIQSATQEQVEASVHSLIERLKESSHPNKPLITALQSMRYIPETHALVFTGNQEAIERIKAIIPDFDVAPEKSKKPLKTIPSSNQFFVYKPKTHDGEALLDSLEEMANSLKKAGLTDESLINTLETAKWVPSTNSLVFAGNTQTIERIKSMLPSIDVGKTTHPSTNDQFFVYKPKNHDGEQLLESLQDVYHNLTNSKLADPSFLKTLKSAKYIKSTNSLIFTGDESSLNEIKNLLPILDEPPPETAPKNVQPNIFIYKLKKMNRRVIQDGLKNISQDLPANDAVAETIKTMRYLPESNSIVFKGDPQTIARIKEMIEVLDSGEDLSGKKTYFLFKLQHAKGSTVIKELENMADNLRSSNIDDQSLINALENAQYVSTSNSIYITGSPGAIDKVKAIVKNFDIEKKAADSSSSFYMYKPKNSSADSLRSSLVDVAEDLRASGLKDQELINSLLSVKVVESSQSLLFTGDSETIDKVKELLPTLDTPLAGSKISSVGETTFLIYKVKHANGPKLINRLQSVAKDLQKSGKANEELIETLNTMRYVPETNSIVFTGPKKALDSALNLAEKFDVSSGDQAPPRTAPEGYVIYTPEHLSGEQLIQIMKDFEQNLQATGVEEQNLFDTINNLKWMPLTSSILISGDGPSVQKVQDLLQRFDKPGEGIDSDKPSIETIDDVSFLIYKLQYHQGSNIQNAMQKIASDLRANMQGDKNKNLIEAIESMQWLQVTNSLIVSGNSATLSKMKELIRNIDMPLRQVFIEVLVVETEDSDNLTFGLRWQSQGLYKDRIGYGTGTLPQVTGGTDPLSSFNTAVTNTSASKAPDPTNIPLATGWDLGVIGDIVLHKGKSYFALGSLVNALQAEGESTIVLNQKIIAQDNQQSTIFVGENVPFVGSVVTTTQNNGNQQNTNLEYRDIGVSLDITPTVGDDNILTLDINQNITEEEETSQNSEPQTGQVNGIRTSKTTTQTRVTLPDQHFLVLSGNMRNTVTRTKTGIPCLGGLPLVGLFFSQNDRTVVTRNVIIFIKPHIINTFQEYQEITQRQEDLYRSQSVPEDFDNALDLLKTPEDER